MDVISSVPAYIFVDAEYCYTCSAREGKQIPNYKNIIDLFNSKFEKSIKIFYHVGSKNQKNSLCSFLNRLGVDYNSVMDYEYASKTQLVASMMAMDVRKCIEKSGDSVAFCFLSGDDYLIPIVDDLHNKCAELSIYYFPSIISRDLWNIIEKNSIQNLSLSNRYFTCPKVNK